MMVLCHLKRHKSDVALLLETHLFLRLQRLWVGRVFRSSAHHNKAGVVILIHKNLPYEISTQLSDDEGRWARIILQLATQRFIIFMVLMGRTRLSFNLWVHNCKRIQLLTK